ncbi:hypothetical protein AXG93_698s1040 [Marchantia polymorpha subsp. ruderalis]|uniref:Uncharacterized protein n=1 Tax=Marchantia polymorpha subsp. ruderalis TaxID=1480154 RepID=A0A176VHH9_MARPO|nr:hypothetical protein AXG93_698s1040 [Marchantia polymorpha subsp. ruderalis]
MVHMKDKIEPFCHMSHISRTSKEENAQPFVGFVYTDALPCHKKPLHDDEMTMRCARHLTHRANETKSDAICISHVCIKSARESLSKAQKICFLPHILLLRGAKGDVDRPSITSLITLGDAHVVLHDPHESQTMRDQARALRRRATFVNRRPPSNMLRSPCMISKNDQIAHNSAVESCADCKQLRTTNTSSDIHSVHAEWQEDVPYVPTVTVAQIEVLGFDDESRCRDEHPFLATVQSMAPSEEEEEEGVSLSSSRLFVAVAREESGRLISGGGDRLLGVSSGCRGGGCSDCEVGRFAEGTTTTTPAPPRPFGGGPDTAQKQGTPLPPPICTIRKSPGSSEQAGSGEQSVAVGRRSRRTRRGIGNGEKLQRRNGCDRSRGREVSAARRAGKIRPDSLHCEGLSGVQLGITPVS